MFTISYGIGINFDIYYKLSGASWKYIISQGSIVFCGVLVKGSQEIIDCESFHHQAFHLHTGDFYYN